MKIEILGIRELVDADECVELLNDDGEVVASVKWLADFSITTNDDDE